MRALVVLAAAVGLAGCGSAAATRTTATRATSATGTARAASPAPAASTDWPTFDGSEARSGVSSSGPAAARLAGLATRRVTVDGVVDSAPIGLQGVRVDGRSRDVIVLTTTYGRTLAIDAGTGTRLWQYTPRDVNLAPGNPRVTTTSPVADPDRRSVYAAAPDGVIRKLSLASGRVLWARRVTYAPRTEKLAGALAVDGPYVVAVTGGYIGDIPPYDGHVVTISRRTGRIAHVWNTECSNRHALISPASCPVAVARGDNAIWGRAGSTIVPDSGDILVATGNGPFNGSTTWGDSVLELSADASRLLHNWTPSNQARLSAGDTDLGSSSPALLGSYGGRQLLVQGGKDGRLHVLDLGRLDGTAGGPGPRLGGELSETATPGGDQLLTQPAVWHEGGHTYLLVADDSGTATYVLRGRRPALGLVWRDGTPGTSPILAAGLEYVYDEIDGKLVVRNPLSGVALHTFPAAVGHWNSPIALGGRIVLPTGSYHTSASTSTLYIYG